MLLAVYSRYLIAIIFNKDNDNYRAAYTVDEVNNDKDDDDDVDDDDDDDDCDDDCPMMAYANDSLTHLTMIV